MENLSIWDMLSGAYGSFWVTVSLWFLLALSLLALTVALERIWVLWQFMGLARPLHETVTKCLARGAFEEGRSACERSRSPLADVFLAGYGRIARSKPENVDAAVHRERVRVSGYLKKRLWFLGTVGAAAPFVGLFGTVVGIMRAFDDLEVAEREGEVGIGVVSGSIAEALIATALGIGIAVLAVMGYNYFQQRLAAISIELKMMTAEFLEHLHESSSERDDAPADDQGGKSKAKGDADGAREAA